MKKSEKQGYTEGGFDCFGRDLRRLQLFFLSDAVMLASLAR